MSPGLFVTGTDTNIGKTVLSAALMHRYRQVLSVRYWKPVQTGFPEDDDTAEVRTLGACPEEEIFDSGIRLPRPLSPHLSAQLAGTTIDMRALAATLPTRAGWIAEGAGGVLVPLNNTDLMIDFIRLLGLAAVVMTRSGLGTINHTLLTIEALRSRRIPVAGVVMGGDLNPENRRAIEMYGRVAVLGEMPRFPELSSTILREWACAELDRGSCLQQFMTGDAE
jgi:dethiobiotin synthetase